MTKLQSTLPKGIRDGLGALARPLLDDPTAPRLIVAQVTCRKTVVDHDTGELIPTARIVAVEAITGKDAAVVEAAMHAAFDRRTSPEDPLPFDVVTGEVTTP